MTIAAIRYNNPGDVSLPIRGWDGGGHIVGLRDQPGYACFPDMQTGFEALQCRLRSYIAEGRNTIRKIGHVYATDPRWAGAVATMAGLSKDDMLDPSNPDHMRHLAGAIVKQETGMTLLELCHAADIYHGKLA